MRTAKIVVPFQRLVVEVLQTAIGCQTSRRRRARTTSGVRLNLGVIGLNCNLKSHVLGLITQAPMHRTGWSEQCHPRHWMLVLKAIMLWKRATLAVKQLSKSGNKGIQSKRKKVIVTPQLIKSIVRTFFCGISLLKGNRVRGSRVSPTLHNALFFNGYSRHKSTRVARWIKVPSRNLKVAGSSLAVSNVLCPWARHFTSIVSL